MHCENFIAKAAVLLIGMSAVDCTSCFFAGTSISTPDGPIPIEAIQVGQSVHAYDETSQKVVISTA